MRVAIYCRVSTDKQSTEMQLTALRDYVSRREWESVEYVDNGFSGSKLKRPELDRLIADAKRKKFDAVVVWKLDRFARSTQFLAQSLVDFSALGVEFISLTEGFDTTTPSGKLLFHIMSGIAEFERDLIRERVCAGLTNAKTRGVRLGRLTKLTDDEREQIGQLRTNGLSYREIAKELGGRVSWMTIRRAMNG